ncbi:MAG: DUF2254 domain-containing protein [Candidatus Izimaplasma sp.]|nr:DUF2254 domain-containing protein [Candidatus Izimaplasma bacterium]
MKKYFNKLKHKYYFVPGIYITVFLILTYLFNAIQNYQIMMYFPDFFISTTIYGENLFPLMIGSVVTLTTITFSLMMVILTMYGSQFSPRTLQDFLSSKNTQHVLGYLLGTLIFSVISFYFLDFYTFNVITPSVATLLFIGAILSFGFFIYYVAKRVQITSYIQNLVEEINDSINEKQKNVVDDKHILFKHEVELNKILEEEPIIYKAENSGYILSYDISGLKALAIESNIILNTERQPGEYVLKNDSLIEIHHFKGDEEELFEMLKKHINISTETSKNSFDEGINKIFDIALRALSPGINDPATTRFCIDNIGYILEKITIILAHTVYTDDENNVRVISTREHFATLLHNYFYEIKLYGFKNITVIKSTLEVLNRISKNTDTFQNKEIWDFTHYLLDDMKLSKLHPYELRPLQQIIMSISENTEQENDFFKET